MARASFSATIAAWAEKIPEASEAVRNESVQDTVKEMQTLTREGGRMRFDTGFLWSSLMASTAAMPRINPNAQPVDGRTYSYDAGTIEAVILNADLTDTIYFGYTAAYAAAREYGTRGQAPDAFVRGAVQNWQNHVNRNAQRVGKAFGLL
jgi:hypothetical protein